MDETIDITIIGAGIIGLAVAWEISRNNKELNIVLIEQHDTFGQEISSRNSEVIHSGIYYSPCSLKAKLCVEGKELLYKICKEYGIPYKQIGKLIVATNNEEERNLDRLFQQGLNNNVTDLKMLSSNEIKQIEPNIKACRAIYSPSTGIIDTHSLMKFLETQAINNGVIISYRCRVTDLKYNGHFYRVEVCDADKQPYPFQSRMVINCAGLSSDKIAEMVGIDTQKRGYKLYYCKGEYFRISNAKNRYISHLIYPCPTDISLGIHTVIDLQGQLKLGPNAFYVDEINYEVDLSHKHEFYESASRFLPFIELSDLTPDMAGIRPKLQASGESTKDFVIQDEGDKGLANMINLIGIESPGITASLAIGHYVNSLIDI